jgi:hypothetical protein
MPQRRAPKLAQFARDYPDVALDLTTIEDRTQPTRCDLTSTGAHHAAQ